MNDFERSFKGKVALDDILSKERSLQYKSEIGFTPKKKENSKIRHNAIYTKNAKCLGCNKKDHFASVCPNKIKDKQMSSKKR